MNCALYYSVQREMMDQFIIMQHCFDTVAWIIAKSVYNFFREYLTWRWYDDIVTNWEITPTSRDVDVWNLYETDVNWLTYRCANYFDNFKIYAKWVNVPMIRLLLRGYPSPYTSQYEYRHSSWDSLWDLRYLHMRANNTFYHRYVRRLINCSHLFHIYFLWRNYCVYDNYIMQICNSCVSSKEK